METYSSGEDLLIKARKPYTITKQRERWTEEEHNRFLEALKLYGRAWQRIEEYIGTKTAVQIRSHAQKFFTKLEKVAHIKGVPIGQTFEIEIPPPRPKRKPSNPYPRKTGVLTPASQVGVNDGKLLPSVSSSCTGKQIPDLEKEPLPEKPGGDGKPESANGNQNEENCSEVITLSQPAPSTSSSSAEKKSLSTPVAPRSLCTFREFVPMITPVNHDETSESHVTAEQKGNKKVVELDTKPPIQDNGSMGNTSNLGNPIHSQEKMVQGWTTAEQMQLENVSLLSSNDIQATQNYPRHVPVHVLDRSLGMNIQNISPDMPYHESMFQQIGGVNGYPNLFANPATSATIECHNASKSSVDQPSPTFHPLFTPVRKNHDGYGSLLQISSTFSSLIVSTLLQNPAAHAAASFAATFWPCANTGASADSLAGPPTLGGLPSPSMAAIAAATVAAATAWWASHGLLPICAPFQTGFTCNPACTTDTCQNAAADNESGANLPRDPEKSEALQEQPSASKSLTLSSDSEESEGAKRHSELASTNHDKVAGATELNDSNKVKIRKLVDRSSCGSNTASSSEVETDALEKYEKGKEESKEPDAGLSAGDSNNRRGRSSSYINDSWKEVSEGGRLAFQALFSRQVLPQSFSPPQDLKCKGHPKINFEKDKQNMGDKIEDGSCLDLNSETGGACSSHQRVESNEFLGGKNNGEGGLLTIGIEQGNLKARRTGFKPYKRCSVEAEEIMVASACSQGEEKGPKRIRLEGEAST